MSTGLDWGACKARAKGSEAEGVTVSPALSTGGKAEPCRPHGHIQSPQEMGGPVGQPAPHPSASVPSQ